MKAKLTILAILAMAFSQLGPTILAQSPARQSKLDRRARWASLTENEKAKLRAAHQKAMADPAVKTAREKLRQARREFREVMHPAMLRADPSIEPILEKMRAQRAGGD